MHPGSHNPPERLPRTRRGIRLLWNALAALPATVAGTEPCFNMQLHGGSDAGSSGQTGKRIDELLGNAPGHSPMADSPGIRLAQQLFLIRHACKLPIRQLQHDFPV